MAQDELTRGTRLAKNSLINFFGYGAPLIVAAVSIPIMIRGIGTDRFGVLSLAWVLIGYLSLFDLGLSRALTKLVAEKLGEGKDDEIPALIWTAVFLMFGLGMMVAIVSWFCLPMMVQKFLNIPPALQQESLNGFYLLILTLPLVIPSIGLRGVLDAYQRFDLSNAVRIPLGIYTFLSPLAVIPFSPSLFPLIGVLVVGRLAGCFAHLIFCFRIVPALSERFILKKDVIAMLFRFGSWMTVTNIISPLMVYSDRFLIGSLVSMSAVAYYATPNEAVTKLWLFPIALTGVFFPAFSASFAQDRRHTAFLFDKGLSYIFVVLYPVSLIIITLAKEGLNIWLGSEFAQQSTLVLQWMTVGVFVHSLGQVPYSLIQGSGRPDLTGKLHIAEIPFYLAGLWWLVSLNGIVGAAMAWLIRIVLDTLIMFVMAIRLLAARVNPRHILALSIAILTFLVGAVLTTLSLKIIFLSVILSAYIPILWCFILSDDERKKALRIIRRYPSPDPSPKRRGE